MTKDFIFQHKAFKDLIIEDAQRVFLSLCLPAWIKKKKKQPGNSCHKVLARTYVFILHHISCPMGPPCLAAVLSVIPRTVPVRKWRSRMFAEWPPWYLSDVLCCPPAVRLFDWHATLRLATLDQHAPALPFAPRLDVTSPLTQPACSHFSLPFASICRPHSIAVVNVLKMPRPLKQKAFEPSRQCIRSLCKKKPKQTEKPFSFYKSTTSMLISKCGF